MPKDTENEMDVQFGKTIIGRPSDHGKEDIIQFQQTLKTISMD